MLDTNRGSISGDHDGYKGCQMQCWRRSSTLSVKSHYMWITSSLNAHHLRILNFWSSHKAHVCRRWSMSGYDDEMAEIVVRSPQDCSETGEQHAALTCLSIKEYQCELWERWCEHLKCGVLQFGNKRGKNDKCWNRRCRLTMVIQWTSLGCVITCAGMYEATYRATRPLHHSHK